MRDFIRLHINGREHEVRGRSVFATLADYLRYESGATGTKIVCAEGDCGACTVLVKRNGDYVPINSCIQSVAQLDGTSVVTVEGLRTADSEQPTSTGHAVQESMIRNHGAQCGYCTPGFVVAMTALFEEKDRVAPQEVCSGLTGNLCRCTGYEPIVKAACAIDASGLPRMKSLFPTPKPERESVLINGSGPSFFAPATLKEALDFKAQNASCSVVAGATDVGVWINKRNWSAPALLSLSKIEELNSIHEDRTEIVVGANVTLAQFERYVETRIPELYGILNIFGSPQIRNAGTLAGNIANASPIADTLPYLFAAEATLELTSARGVRMAPITTFYKGYKSLDLAADELITRIRVPKPAAGYVLRLYKVSRRKDLDISAFTAAIRLRVTNGTIGAAAIAFGGVGPVVLRLAKTEEFLRSREATLETFLEAGRTAREEVSPISDVRGSRDYRLQLAENIFLKFYYETFSNSRGDAEARGATA